MSTMRRTTTLTALLLGATLLAPIGAATAAGETCQGKAATIVGTGPAILGTPGDDVIVTGASIEVQGGGGNDTICVSTTIAVTNVHTGDGDDLIDASTLGGTSTSLGGGSDLFIGGPGPDGVVAAGADDTITGAGGEDSIQLYTTQPDASAMGSYDGGDGEDLIAVHNPSLDVDMELDELLSIGGTPVATVSGFTNARVEAQVVALRGNPEGNHLLVSGCDLRADGEGGDDDVIANYTDDGWFPAPCDHDARLSGGRGDDNVMGWRGADRLVGGAGNDVLDGRTGNDRVVGGTGRDQLVGGPDRDVLLGGPGRDKATGGKGNHDRCSAEVTKTCER
jgi:Ca2+-binding RTX toxin-like protein